MAALADLRLLRNVDVTLSVELGRVRMTLEQVLALAADDIVRLDRLTDEPLDILVNNERIGHAEILVEDGRFALRVLALDGTAPGSGALAAGSI
ncbi:flagellar motor switch protein FliN [Erythrobacteraceae bacterium CFH 75059]|nr:flagellar motor switch protein FliN [Erythrobacteraceae bacterium CFH 75059]